MSPGEWGTFLEVLPAWFAFVAFFVACFIKCRKDATPKKQKKKKSDAELAEDARFSTLSQRHEPLLWSPPVMPTYVSPY